MPHFPFPSRWFPAAAAALCALWSAPTVAQSIECRKPSNAVERAVCASADLRARDEQLGEAYAALLAYTPRGERDDLQRAHAAWLSERDRACDDKAKAKACTALYEKRTDETTKLSQAAQKRLAIVVASIPKDAKAAAAALQRYDGAAAKAWLLYLYHTGAVTTADKDAEVRRLAGDILNKDLVKTPYLIEEIVNIGDVATADTGGLLLFLRHVLSTTELDAPCFLFTRHGLPAFEAFGVFWGDGRDDTPELCQEPRSVFDLPEWKKLDALFEPAAAPALDEGGGLRLGYERQVAVDTLQASLMPATMLEAPRSPDGKRAAEARDRAVAAFRGWKEHRVWPEVQHKAAVAALPSAITATSKFYQETFKLPAKAADQAARAAADRFIAGRMAPLIADEAPDEE